MRSILITLLVATLFNGCSQPHQVEDPASIVAQIEQQRSAKNISFKQMPGSPIPDEHLTGFQGLDYFPVNLNYRFRLSVHRYDNPETFKMITSSGAQRETRRYGYFDFKIDGQPCRLNVYQMPSTREKYPNLLFVPFVDGTSGRSTYGGGRYIDLKTNESGVYDLDFNYAYNPSCAYGKPGYSCPIPPSENRLAVAIRAGEKAYPLAGH